MYNLTVDIRQWCQPTAIKQYSCPLYTPFSWLGGISALPITRKQEVLLLGHFRAFIKRLKRIKFNLLSVRKMYTPIPARMNHTP